MLGAMDADGRRPLLVGNWKMNGLASARAEVSALLRGLKGREARRDIGICPPTTLLAGLAREFADTPILWGGQDCHPQPSGAHTGDISAEMLADAGASLVLVGHSERRRDHRESNPLIRAKIQAAQRAGLRPILCIGESLAQRQGGAALRALSAQLRLGLPEEEGGDVIIAYEPLWAIGSGKTPKPAEVDAAHAHIRHHLEQRAASTDKTPPPPILYGGSLGPKNAADILSLRHVGGGLIGGASLRAEDFLAVIAACAPVGG